jgi:ABC-2 type transport system permease protein
VGAATRIASKDLKLRIRDRSVFILGVLAPLVLAFIFNFVFGSGLEGNLDLQYGVVDEDNTDISASFTSILEQLQSEGLLTLTEFDDRASAEAADDAGDVQAFYLIGPGMEQAVIASEPFEIQVVGDIDAPTFTQIASSIAEQFGSGVAGAQLSVATSVSLVGTPPPVAAGWGQEAAARPPSYVISDVTSATRQLDATTYFAAGMAVFFVFFTVQFGVTGLLEEQREGTLARLLAAPIPRASVIVAKGLLSFWLGVISVGLLIIASSLLMGAEWGPPLGVIVLVVCVVLAAVAIMGLVASVAKTPEGAGNLGAIIAVILGMLGGTFFPIGQGDDLLSKLTYLTPHAWFMRGLADISGGAPWTDVLPAALALLIFATVLGAISWFALRRKVLA